MPRSSWFVGLWVVVPIAVTGEDRAWLAGEETSLQRAMREALDRPVSIRCEETPLADALDELERMAGIDIVLDQKALSDAGVGPGTTLAHLDVADVRLRSALDLILDPLELTWLPRSDTLFITTKSEAENMLDIKIYPVDDLVIDQRSQSSGYDALLYLIRSTIKQDTWDETGGPGTVETLELPGIHALVVSQTRDVHEEIVTLLAALRRLRGVGSLSAESPRAASTPPRVRQEKTPECARTYVDAPHWTLPQTHDAASRE